MGKTKQQSRKKMYEICKKKLIEIKEHHLNILQGLSSELVKETSGDIGDQARQLQEETMSLARRDKLNSELNEIEGALQRIKNNTFGVCEETGTPIEERRLKAIPWARLSLEGAEIREMEKEDKEKIG